MKFSINTKEFEENLIKLREELNNSLLKGKKVSDDFKDELFELEEKQEAMEKELLSYYKSYGDNIYKSKIEITPIKLEGSFNSESYLKSSLKIDEYIFLFAYINQKLHFARILDEGVERIELSQAVKNFDDLIIYMKKINDNKILAFSISGGIYILSYEDIDSVFENINSLKIYKFKTYFRGFENVIELGNNKFLLQTLKSDLTLLEFNEDYSDFNLIIEKEISIEEDEISSLVEIGDYKFLMGTRGGFLIKGELKTAGISISEKIKIFEGPLNKLWILENFNLQKEYCACLGNDGNFAFFNFKKNKIIKLKSEKIAGKLFEIKSKNGTSIFLSEDGLVYV
ncbi:MAG: hypothetical protein ACLR8B_07185, partial [Peptoniphilus harei]